MNQQEFEFLKTHLSDEKKFIGDGYYRLRQIDDTTYEFAHLVSDACGATSVHPQITIEWNGDEWKPIKLFDFFETPIKNICYSKENQRQLSEELTNLYSSFVEVVNKQVV